MKRIKYLNVRDVRTQGIVGDDVTIRMSIASFQPVDSPLTSSIGFSRAMRSFCP
jgi:hypothetical protein